MTGVSVCMCVLGTITHCIVLYCIELLMFQIRFWIQHGIIFGLAVLQLEIMFFDGQLMKIKRLHMKKSFAIDIFVSFMFMVSILLRLYCHLH